MADQERDENLSILMMRPEALLTYARAGFDTFDMASLWLRRDRSWYRP
ncbi:MAG: hypothetical protein ACKVLN_04940 [Rhodobacterales bacterium]|jgi:hypothetical protein